MYIHTGCSFWTFPYHALSNASSNLLLHRMHSYIGCIHEIFLHHVFSNVVLNRFSLWMHKHTECICLSCFHHALSLSLVHCLNSDHISQDSYPLPRNVSTGRRVSNLKKSQAHISYSDRKLKVIFIAEIIKIALLYPYSQIVTLAT